MPADRTSRVQSVDRAMLLLRAVASADPAESTAARLGDACGVNRVTAWRILNTLEAHEMVACDRATGRWSVGLSVVDIAESASTEGLVAAARPGLERLSRETGETAALAVWRRGALTYVDEVVPSAIVTATWLDQTVPLHATSTGKVLLTFGDVPISGRPGRPGLQRFTDSTITTVRALDDELAAVERRGYATCRGEYEESAWGVSAPVLGGAGQLVAVLSVWGPANRVTRARLGELGPVVRAAAATLLPGPRAAR